MDWLKIGFYMVALGTTVYLTGIIISEIKKEIEQEVSK
jgi:hypothetical protein